MKNKKIITALNLFILYLIISKCYSYYTNNKKAVNLNTQKSSINFTEYNKKEVKSDKKPVKDTDKVNNYTSKVYEYLPNNKVINTFSGDFENGGKVSYYRNFSDNKIEKLSINTGTGMVEVFKNMDNKIIKVYSKSGIENFKDNYISCKENTNEVILKEPIKVGTTWENKDENNKKITYKIIDVDKTVYLDKCKINCVIVNKRFDEKNSINYYYAKGKGLVKTSGMYGIKFKDEYKKDNDFNNWEKLLNK